MEIDDITAHPVKPNCWLTPIGEYFAPAGSNAPTVLSLLQQWQAEEPEVVAALEVEEASRRALEAGSG